MLVGNYDNNINNNDNNSNKKNKLNFLKSTSHTNNLKHVVLSRDKNVQADAVQRYTYKKFTDIIKIQNNLKNNYNTKALKTVLFDLNDKQLIKEFIPIDENDNILTFTKIDFHVPDFIRNKIIQDKITFPQDNNNPNNDLWLFLMEMDEKLLGYMYISNNDLKYVYINKPNRKQGNFKKLLFKAKSLLTNNSVLTINNKHISNKTLLTIFNKCHFYKDDKTNILTNTDIIYDNNINNNKQNKKKVLLITSFHSNILNNVNLDDIVVFKLPCDLTFGDRWKNYELLGKGYNYTASYLKLIKIDFISDQLSVNTGYEYWYFKVLNYTYEAQLIALQKTFLGHLTGIKPYYSCIINLKNSDHNDDIKYDDNENMNITPTTINNNTNSNVNNNNNNKRKS